MSMSTWVTALRSADNPEYQKQLNVLKACREAGVSKLPPETAKYFEQDYHPQDVDEENALVVKIPSQKWNDRGIHQGIEINVADIPSGVSKIRFINSY